MMAGDSGAVVRQTDRWTDCRKRLTATVLGLVSAAGILTMLTSSTWTNQGEFISSRVKFSL
jgi:hypothetical protein